MYCLRAFIVVLQELHYLRQCLPLVCFENHVNIKFGLNWFVVSVSYMPIRVPIVMYGLRLFIVVIQELHLMTLRWSFRSSISMQSLVPRLCLVIEIRESKLKKKKRNNNNNKEKMKNSENKLLQF